ncbi:MAG: SRPBCC family protein [bacterium]|nr:SRPBCC family protein [bacterium]
MTQRRYQKHYEETVKIAADASNIFAFADNHTNFSAHMNQSSWMMGGGKMETQTDEGRGKRVGSHIRMGGRIFGVRLFLDEVVIQHESPYRKAWETVGQINLAVIDHYKLGFEIMRIDNSSKLKVYIDYNLPISQKAHWFGVLFGEIYAKWCVRQMSRGVKDHFQTE